MRVLFTTQPGSGHFHWLVPLAHALRDSGHEVAVACAPAFRPAVEAADLRMFGAGFDWLIATSPYAFTEDTGGAREPAGREWLRRQAFLQFITTHMLDDLLTLGASWLPDLVIRETAEYAGCVAAEYWGVPHVVVGKALGSDYAQRARRAALLTMARERVGLPADPAVDMPYRYLHLIPEPPGFHPPEEPLAPTAHFVRPGRFDRSGDEELPPWITSLPARPTVHATLGTVMNRTSRLFDVILNALYDEPLNLILTVGRTRDPASFGPPRTGLHIERYIPHSLLLPHCDTVITQGSINTVMTALSYGVPLVLLPIAGEQPFVARRCAALGVGWAIGKEEQTAEAIRAAVRAVLGQRCYREGAAQMGREIAAMPDAGQATRLLEQLVRERRPLLAAELPAES